MGENLSPPSVAILGGGITGLAAALKLSESRPELDWKLFEAEPRLGGVIDTAERGDWLIERSADNFLTREPGAIDLCRHLGLEGELLETDPTRRRALVVNRGKVTPVPEGFVLMSPRSLWPTIASPVLSLKGKLRLACEPIVKGKKLAEGEDESVASFATRRLGREVFERIVQPLVAGIYTADPHKLSMAATLPQFLKQEKEHGSLWRAAQRQPVPQEDAESGARYGLFLAPRGGMQQLVEAIVNRLPTDRLCTSLPVGKLQKNQDAWEVCAPEGEMLGRFDSVIVTLPSYRAADALSESSPNLTKELSGIEYAGASVVCLGYREDQIQKPINGFGFVVPSIEGRRIIAASFASYKFPGRAPDGRVLIRVFLGGALQPELAELSDEELVRISREELADLVGLRGEPEMVEIARWPRRMPQYHVGHLDRVMQIERLASEEPGLELAGAAYRGVGVPQCITSGERAADRALSYLADRV